MTYEEMTELIENEFALIRELRETKGREYAGLEDTLADFKEVAVESGTSPLQVWLTYVKKHERARDTFIREGQVKSESIRSRIRDIAVYHLLLIGLVEDLEYKSLQDHLDVQIETLRQGIGAVESGDGPTEEPITVDTPTPVELNLGDIAREVQRRHNLPSTPFVGMAEDGSLKVGVAECTSMVKHEKTDGQPMKCHLLSGHHPSMHEGTYKGDTYQWGGGTGWTPIKITVATTGGVVGRAEVDSGHGRLLLGHRHRDSQG